MTPKPFHAFDFGLVQRCAAETAAWHLSEAMAHLESAATYPQIQYADIHTAFATFLRETFDLGATALADH